MKLRQIIKNILPYGISNWYLSKRLPNDPSSLKTHSDSSNEVLCIDKNLDIKFYCVNDITRDRALTFFTKEPETLDWINSFEKESILYDIGANIGLYSIYAAKLGHRVYAFEPSVFNLKLLAMNIDLNFLHNNITIISSPLHDKYLDSFFKMSQAEEGGSCSTFNEEYDQFGNKIKSIFKYKTISIPGDFYTINNIIPLPDYIKIDVDGIEHIVLNSLRNSLSNCKSLLVEMDEKFQLQVDSCFSFLKSHGYRLLYKKHGKMFDDINSPTHTTFNYIFHK